MEHLESFDHLFNDLLVDISAVLACELKKHGVDECKADRVANYQAFSLAKEVGGMLLYIPKAKKVSNFLRDKDILKDYNKLTVKQLSKKYNLSEDRLRRILRQQTKEKYNL